MPDKNTSIADNSTSTAFSDEYWMAKAIVLAEKAEALGEVPVGALVVRDNQLVGEGWNQPISSNDPTAHAEIMALRAAGKVIGNYRLSDCDLYISLEPCAMCAGAIVHARIRRVIFAATEPKAGAVISTDRFFDRPANNHQVDVLGGVLQEKSSLLISDFFKRRRQEKKSLKKQRKLEDSQ